MADDLAGLKTTLKEAFDRLVNDKSISYNAEPEMQALKGLIALIRARATANSVTGLS